MVSAVKQRVVSIVEKVKRVWQSRNAKLLRENKALLASFHNAQIDTAEHAKEIARITAARDQVASQASKLHLDLAATEKRFGELSIQLEANKKYQAKIELDNANLQAQLATKANDLEQAHKRVAWLEAELEALQERHGTVKQVSKDRLAGVEKSVLDALNAVRQLDSELVV